MSRRGGAVRCRRTSGSAPKLGRRRRGVRLEAGALVEGPGDHVEQPLERLEVAGGRGGERLLDLVVARDVDGVDAVHRRGDVGRAGCRAAPCASARASASNATGRRTASERRGVAAQGRRQRAEARGVVDPCSCSSVEQVVDERAGRRRRRSSTRPSLARIPARQWRVVALGERAQHLGGHRDAPRPCRRRAAAAAPRRAARGSTRAMRGWLPYA